MDKNYFILLGKLVIIKGFMQKPIVLNFNLAINFLYQPSSYIGRRHIFSRKF